MNYYSNIFGFSLDRFSQFEWMMIDNNKWMTIKMIVN